MGTGLACCWRSSARCSSPPPPSCSTGRPTTPTVEPGRSAALRLFLRLLRTRAWLAGQLCSARRLRPARARPARRAGRPRAAAAVQSGWCSPWSWARWSTAGTPAGRCPPARQWVVGRRSSSLGLALFLRQRTRGTGHGTGRALVLADRRAGGAAALGGRRWRGTTTAGHAAPGAGAGHRRRLRLRHDRRAAQAGGARSRRRLVDRSGRCCSCSLSARPSIVLRPVGLPGRRADRVAAEPDRARAGGGRRRGLAGLRRAPAPRLCWHTGQLAGLVLLAAGVIGIARAEAAAHAAVRAGPRRRAEMPPVGGPR